MSNFQLELKYNPKLTLVFKLVGFVLIVTQLLVIRYHIAEYPNQGLLKALGTAIVSSTFILTAIRYWWMFFRKVQCKYQLVQNSGVEIQKGSKKWSVDFNQVNEVKKTILPPQFMGGFKVITKSGQVFYFLSSLQNHHEYLKQLQLRSHKIRIGFNVDRYLEGVNKTNEFWLEAFKGLFDILLWVLKYALLPTLLYWIKKYLSDESVSFYWVFAYTAICAAVGMFVFQIYFLLWNFIKQKPWPRVVLQFVFLALVLWIFSYTVR